LPRQHRAKTVTGWMGAACVLAMACVCLSPGRAAAQSDASSTSSAGNSTAPSPRKKAGGTKTANPRKHAKAAASESAANQTASPRSAHPASHPPADKHPKSNTAAAAHNNKAKHPGSRKNKKKTARGQQKIDPERARAIQEALIREHYMTGEPAGTWNQASEDAMRRYQADHGWQSKTVPDSRALISLGLGPSKDHLLNPESAMTTGPDVSHAASAASAPQRPVSHSAEHIADPGAEHNAEPSPRMSTNPGPAADPVPATTADHDASSPQ
jgi:hypothetical protein